MTQPPNRRRSDQAAVRHGSPGCDVHDGTRWSRAAAGRRRELPNGRQVSEMGTVVGHPAYAPQFLSWFAAQGISMPPQGGNISSQWVASVETSLTGFVSNVIVATLVPILAAFCVLKAALDAAEGHSPLASIVAGTFLL